MKPKKILVLGVGAQGSAAAKKLDTEPNVEEIVCADYDKKAVDSVVQSITKGRGVQVDAHDTGSIIAAAKGVDLILNGLPLECAQNVLDAALAVKTNYQDYAGTTELYDLWRGSEEAKVAPPSPSFKVQDAADWYDSVRALYEIYGPKFAAIGKLAIFGTGSAPGLICVATRDTMRHLDTCDTIYNIVWEGVVAKRFIPFWWSPVTALNDMADGSIKMENGVLTDSIPFGEPITRQYDYMEEPIVFREHSHDEPLQYSFHADTLYKGCQNIYFKYAGAGMDLCAPLAQAGLLSREKERVGDVEVAPFDVVLSHIPPAPKYKDEIKEILDEGLISDSGCMVIEAYGKKDGKDILVENHVMAPGLAESYERAGITAEMYLTGQAGYLYSKMFINEQFDQTGMISSDMLTMEQVDTYFDYAGELDITRETIIKEL